MKVSSFASTLRLRMLDFLKVPIKEICHLELRSSQAENASGAPRLRMRDFLEDSNKYIAHLELRSSQN